MRVKRGAGISRNRLRGKWGRVYRQMKYEIETNWIQEDTIIASYQFATNHRSRKWLFHKWLNAIMKWHGYSKRGMELLRVNSDRAVEKVTRRYWWDAQSTGDPCRCYICLSGWGTTHPEKYLQSARGWSVSEEKKDYEGYLDELVLEHSQGQETGVGAIP